MSRSRTGARYDPRAGTGLPTEPVGSLPRPVSLRRALACHAAGRISDAELAHAEDAAVRDTLDRGRATGAPIVSDGEHRRRPPDIVVPVPGRVPVTAHGGHDLHPFGHGRPGPHEVAVAAGSYFPPDLAASVRYAAMPVKQAVTAVSMLAPYLADGPVDETLVQLADLCERDVRDAFEAGAARVSVDFSALSRVTPAGARVFWSQTDLLPHFVMLMTAVLDRFTARERAAIGVHLCTGGHRDDGPATIRAVLPALLRIDAGYFLVQLAGEPDRDAICTLAGRHLRAEAGGISPIVHLGVVDPLSPRVESPREVADLLVRAARYLPSEQLGSTDDCGFSPFWPDDGVSRSFPDVAREIAFRKIRSRVRGTIDAAERLGIG